MGAKVPFNLDFLINNVVSNKKSQGINKSPYIKNQMDCD